MPNTTFNNLQCQLPNACAREPATGKLYCCDYNDGLGNICWSITSECASNNSTRFCGTGDRTWCCLYETESCTKADNQLNICWNNERSPLGNISSQVLEDTYSSLRATAPSATTWAFDPQSLIPTTSTSTPSTTTAVTTSTQRPSSSSASLSGGVIAGIVVGVVAMVAIVVGGGVYLLKRHRRRQNPITGSSPAELLAHREPPMGQLYDADGKAVNLPRTVHELPANNQ